MSGEPGYITGSANSYFAALFGAALCFSYHTGVEFRKEYGVYFAVLHLSSYRLALD